MSRVKIFLQLAVLFSLLTLVGCSAPGDNNLVTESYNSDQDVYIVFHGRHFDNATAFLPNALITELTFDLQEGTHESITDLSGAEVDHYYIWLCLGQACIPVDPFRYNY